MKNFFEHQEQARQKTFWLGALFALAVLLIIAAVNLTALFASGMVAGEQEQPNLAALPTELLLWVSGATLLVILSGTLYKFTVLSKGGGAAVAEMFDGQFLSHSTQRTKERTLLNVVEEMAIAAGIAPPRVYLMDSPAINAFAAGTTINTAVIGVTKGCLDKLSRQELQGVVAHEFSHIMNGDMKNNLRLIGLLHGILLLAITGRILLRATSRSSGGRNSGQGKALFFLIGLSLLIIGYIGVFFGKLIKAAVSRQREFLADATAVQYTRDPEGIHGALAKIAAHQSGSYMDDPNTEEVAHLFFGNALSKANASFSAFFGLLSTHPPLDERMRRILPEKSARRTPAKPKPFAEHAISEAVSSLSSTSQRQIEESVGQLNRDLVNASSAWLADLPKNIQESLATPQSAASLTIAILLNNLNPFYREQRMLPPELRINTQLPDNMIGNIPRHIWQQAEGLVPSVAKLRHGEILPLVELALSTLRELPKSELTAIAAHVAAFQGYSEAESVSGYIISTLIRARLHDTASTAVHPTQKNAPAHEISMVLSVLARFGHPETEDAAAAAYQSGVSRVQGSTLRQGQILPPILAENECTFHRFDHALFSLRSASPLGRKAILSACLACIAHDKEVTTNESELFRAVAAVLDCPTPPDLLGVRSALPNITMTL
jgi:Zn-dependent protease with chaperone function